MFTISKSSNVDLNDKKVNFYDLALDKIGEKLKDLSSLSNQEAVIMFNLLPRLMDKDESQIELSDEDMEFVKKHIGDIK